MGDLRAQILQHLRESRPALDERIHAVVRDVDPRGGEEDIVYEIGQYAAVVETISFAVGGIENPGTNQDLPPIPLAQARRAARLDIPLETLLRRYHASEARLVEIIKHEIDLSEVANHQVATDLLVAVQRRTNRLVAAVAAEFERENAPHSLRPDERTELVRRLLVGVTADASQLDYQLDGSWHICMIAIGATAERAVTAVANALDRSLLSVPLSKTHVWAWLGGSRRLPPTEIARVPLGGARSGLTLAISEPSRNHEGWRLAHRQAQAALRIALIEQRSLLRYADVALLAPFLVDVAMSHAFVHTYLGPLNRMRDHGKTARETLRAYFAAGGLYKVAADALGLHRHTVKRRIEAVERELGYPPLSRHLEIGLALRLEGFLEHCSSQMSLDALASRVTVVPG